MCSSQFNTKMIFFIFPCSTLPSYEVNFFKDCSIFLKVLGNCINLKGVSRIILFFKPTTATQYYVSRLVLSRTVTLPAAKQQHRVCGHYQLVLNFSWGCDDFVQQSITDRIGCVLTLHGSLSHPDASGLHG